MATTRWPWMNGRNGANRVVQDRPLTDVERQFLLREMVSNATTLRAHFLTDLFDDRRSVEDECGWPPNDTSIDIEVYRQLYDRDPLGARVVQLMPKECWQMSPSVYEDEDADEATEFEQAWDDLGKQLSSQGGSGQSYFQDETGSPIWSYLQRADELSGIGHFGILLLGIDDGRNLQEPVDGVMVVNKYKREPILHNGIGNPRHTGRIIGSRVVVESSAPAMPDSPIHPNELDALRNPKPCKVWVRNERARGADGRLTRNVQPVYRTVTPAPLTAEESQALNAMEAEAKQIDDWQRAGHRVVANRGRWTTEEAVANAKGTGGGQSKARKIDTSKMSPGMQPSGQASTSSGFIPSPFVQGSDMQQDYSQLWAPGTQPFGASVGYPPSGPLATPGAPSSESSRDAGSDFANGGAIPAGSSLSGTDQQYFGVQYGPSEALDEEPTRKQHKLLFLRPFDESLVQIVRYEWNIRNPRFGLPVMYRVTLNDPREQHSGIGLPLATVFVHWSRVIHLADNLKSSEIFGVPRMRPVLNSILDARKVRGGSAEGYWKAGCVPLTTFETQPQLGGDVEINQQQVLDMWEQVQNGLQRAMTLEGITAKQLPPSIADPTPYHALQEEVICIQLGCPMRVFKGAERGELASSQDDEAWNERVVARRIGYVTPKLICPLIDRLILLGVLPEPDGYSVEWPDPDALSDTDKSKNCLTNTQALGAYISGNCEAVLTPKAFLTHPKFMDLEEEDAEAILDDSEEAHDQQDTMTMPPQIAGHDQPPPDGSHLAEQEEQQAKDKKAQLDAFKNVQAATQQAMAAGGGKGGPPGAGGKPGAPGAAPPPKPGNAGPATPKAQVSSATQKANAPPATNQEPIISWEEAFRG